MFDSRNDKINMLQPEVCNEMSVKKNFWGKKKV